MFWFGYRFASEWVSFRASPTEGEKGTRVEFVMAFACGFPCASRWACGSGTACELPCSSADRSGYGWASEYG